MRKLFNKKKNAIRKKKKNVAPELISTVAYYLFIIQLQGYGKNKHTHKWINRTISVFHLAAWHISNFSVFFFFARFRFMPKCQVKSRNSAASTIQK